VPFDGVSPTPDPKLPEIATGRPAALVPKYCWRVSGRDRSVPLRS